MQRHNSYTIDKDGKIIHVDLKWDLFALENQGKINVLKDQILGRKVTDFIVGDHVRMWYESLITLARVSGKRVEREYRCDSPTHKRYMLMMLIPFKNGNLRIDHYLLKEEKIEKKIEIDFSGKYSNIITRCSSCNRFYYKYKWIDIDELAKLLDISKITVSDVICNDCVIRELV
jgi:uncharacterized CHY-type Zn-finger protein